MKQLLLILLTMIFLGVITYRQEGSNLLLLQIHDKSNQRNISKDACGCITLMKDFSHSNFFAQVPFDVINSSHSPANFTPSANMLISLKSRTLLASNKDLNLDPLNCSLFGCQKHPEKITSYESSYFTAIGCFVEARPYLGNHNWILENPAVYSVNHTKGIALPYGNGTVGILGLGVGKGAQNNFKSPNPVFSISLSNSSGELCFCENLGQTNSERLVAKLSANTEWRNMNGQGVQLGSKVFSINKFKLMFDINEETIGFPSKIFIALIASFNSSVIPIKCQMNLFRPNCTYHGQLSSLPDITILVENQKLVLTPEIYVKGPENYDATQGTFTLNIRDLHRKAETPYNYVTEFYRNHIILGASFMRKYNLQFTVDGKNNNTIKIYKKPENSSSSSLFELLVCIGLIGIVGVTGICCWIKRKEQTSNQNLLVPALEKEEVGVQVESMENNGSTINFSQHIPGVSEIAENLNQTSFLSDTDPFAERLCSKA